MHVSFKKNIIQLFSESRQNRQSKWLSRRKLKKRSWDVSFVAVHKEDLRDFQLCFTHLSINPIQISKRTLAPIAFNYVVNNYFVPNNQICWTEREPFALALFAIVFKSRTWTQNPWKYGQNGARSSLIWKQWRPMCAESHEDHFCGSHPKNGHHEKIFAQKVT